MEQSDDYSYECFPLPRVYSCFWWEIKVLLASDNLVCQCGIGISFNVMLLCGLFAFTAAIRSLRKSHLQTNRNRNHPTCIDRVLTIIFDCLSNWLILFQLLKTLRSHSQVDYFTYNAKILNLGALKFLTRDSNAITESYAMSKRAKENTFLAQLKFSLVLQQLKMLNTFQIQLNASYTHDYKTCLKIKIAGLENESIKSTPPHSQTGLILSMKIYSLFFTMWLLNNLSLIC